MTKKYIIFFVFAITFIIVLTTVFSILGLLPKKTYDNSDFDIENYISEKDADGDGIDDQTDILNSVYDYIATNPKYKSKYYGTGYPDDNYGVCTDVVAFGLKASGYDIMMLLNEHIISNRDLYNIDIVDKNIDFRRVLNLDTYFKHNFISLTTDIDEIEEWQGGDIVVFERHIGIVSPKRNKKGISYVIHHANPYQLHYEEDILEGRDDIIGHYRVN